MAPPRRRFVRALARGAMTGGLLAGYGGFAVVAGRFLYPSRSRERRWQVVTDLASFPSGAARAWTAPNGERVTIARRGTRGDVSDFIALSSTCPHLGCQVHWQSAEREFFCPCHNGRFDAAGTPLSGPPAQAGTPLSGFPLRVSEGLLYILVPVTT